MHQIYGKRAYLIEQLEMIFGENIDIKDTKQVTFIIEVVSPYSYEEIESRAKV